MKIMFGFISRFLGLYVIVLETVFQKTVHLGYLGLLSAVLYTSMAKYLYIFQTFEKVMASNDAIVVVALLALLTVVAVVAGLTNAIVGFITTLGVPAGIAGQFGAIVFWGTLLALIVAIVQALR
jgi:hypothetical protein